jgi:hypothetical protein
VSYKSLRTAAYNKREKSDSIFLFPSRIENQSGLQKSKKQPPEAFGFNQKIIKKAFR